MRSAEIASWPVQAGAAPAQASPDAKACASRLLRLRPRNQTSRCSSRNVPAFTLPTEIDARFP
jgi:hypothetical protein